MRILHLVPYYPPERLGGVGTFVARLHHGLLDAGHRSIVVTRGDGSEEGVHRIAHSAFGWFVKSVGWIRHAAASDIVHVQSGEALPLVLVLAMLPRRRVRLLATFHVSAAQMARSAKAYSIDGRIFGGGWRCFVNRTLVLGFHRILDTITAVLVDSVVTVSRSTARETFGPRWSERANVIYHGLQPLSPSVSRENVDPVELLYVGASGHRKRVFSLPAILSRVRRRVRTARLRIVGFDLDREPELRSTFSEFGLLSFVESVGYVPPERLVSYYAQAQVLLVPSVCEGLPLVVLEAMQAGLPVVATNVSGLPEVIQNDVNGFLVDLDSPGQVAARCIDLLTDAELHQRVSAAAMQTIERRFSEARFLSEHLLLYKRMIDAHEKNTSDCEAG